MGISADGQYYEDEGEYLQAQVAPKRVYITGESGSESEAKAPPEASTEVTGALDDDGSPLTPGNIDLTNRPRVKNPDGSISTVRSLSFGTDEGEVLVPTVHPEGRIMSDDEAMQRYRETGEHLGIFKTPEAATKYAEQLHKDQEAMYVEKPGMFRSFLDRLSIANAVKGMLSPSTGEDTEILKGMYNALKLPGDAASGKVPMYEVDPEDGKIHIAQDAIEKSFDLAGMVMSGTLSGRIHLRNSPSHEILTTDRSVPITPEQWRTVRPQISQADENFFSQVAREWEERDAAATARMSSQDTFEQVPFPYTEAEWNGLEHIDFRNFHERIHPDQMTDHDFYRWGEYQPENGMTPAQEARWIDIDETIGSSSESRFGESPRQLHERPLEREEISPSQRLRDSINEARTRGDDDFYVREEPGHHWWGIEGEVLQKSGDITLMRNDLTPWTPKQQRLIFKIGDDKFGTIDTRLKENGKLIYVDGMYGQDGFSVHDFGRENIKNLLQVVANHFPGAHYIEGFRVSGMRGRANKPALARMRLPGREKIPELERRGNKPK